VNRERLATLVEIALSVALATVLGLFNVFKMPQGGSVSLEMLPLFVLALRRGVGPGVLAGALYGCVDLVMNPYIVHPAQVLLDYPLAYGFVGLSGLWARRWREAHARGALSLATSTVLLPALALGALGRYVAHVVSGVIFFAQYAPKGQPVILYSALYNTYVPVAAVLCFAAAAIVLPSLERWRASGSATPELSS
jgi:thiamine transporter